MSPRSLRTMLPVCLLVLKLGCELSGGPFSAGVPAFSQPGSGTESVASATEQARLSAEEAALRHKALMRAHRKRIIETGKNDHAPTPEEYSPELELYKKPLRTAPQSSGNQGRNNPVLANPAVVNPAGSQSAANQVELHTDIRLETEKPGAPKPVGTDQFVSKRMHSESAQDARSNSPAIDFKPYMAQLSKKIKDNWSPPARQDKTAVAVNFILMPDGAIGNLKITKHGSPGADEAARQAILRAAPFAHLPKGCNVPKQIDYDFTHSSHADEPSFQWGLH